MMELVDVGDSKSPGSDAVPVRVRPGARRTKPAILLNVLLQFKTSQRPICDKTAGYNLKLPKKHFKNMKMFCGDFYICYRLFSFTPCLHLLKVKHPMNDESTLCDAGCFFEEEMT